MDAEQYNLEILQSLGDKSLVQEFYVPAAFLSNEGTNFGTFIAAETAFIGAYLAATRRMAELNQPRLAATTAQHACSEMVHLSLIRDVAGLIPNPNALPAPIYYNVSDAVPTLRPFLTGGTGFVSPVKAPSKDQVKAPLSGTAAVRVPPFVSVC